MPTLIFGSDHAGFELKEKLKAAFVQHEVVDMGTNSTESCDYPLFAEKVGKEVLKKKGNLGILICGTGIGMSIAANKVKGIRAAAVSEPLSARMSREHNDAQILCLGARVIDFAKAKECVEAFLSASFDTSNPRHAKRVEQIAKLDS